MLKDYGCVGEAEGHDCVFEMAVACAEGCLPLITGANPEQVVGSTKVKLGEDLPDT
jgi:hypothetical protein